MAHLYTPTPDYLLSSNTVEPVLKDSPIGHKKGLSRQGGLRWQRPLKAGFTVAGVRFN